MDGFAGGFRAAGFSSSAHGRRARLLVVDDDAGVRSFLAELLGEAGYEVLCAAEPPEIGALVDLRPDLLLLDLVIGGHDDGIAYLRDLRDDPEASWVPVVVCSGADILTENALDGLVPWHGGIVRKPFEIDDLLAAVERAHWRAQWPPATIVVDAAPGLGFAPSA